MRALAGCHTHTVRGAARPALPPCRAHGRAELREAIPPAAAATSARRPLAHSNAGSAVATVVTTCHAPPPPPPPPPPEPEEQALRGWIEQHGGYISDKIRLVPEAECGSRGVVAVEVRMRCAAKPCPPAVAATRGAALQDISLDELLEGPPPLLVPESLYLTSAEARQALGPLCRG
jgi:hypothetical protein